MNRILYITLIITLIAGSGCRPEIGGDLGDGWDHVKGMIGSWKLKEFIQQDLNSPIKEERDLTHMYAADGVTPLELTFNHNPRDYSTSIEMGKNFFGDSGSWSFDDDLYPSFLYLDTGIDTLSFDLGRMVREIDSEMHLEIQGGCRNDWDIITTETVIYKFVFERQ